MVQNENVTLQMIYDELRLIRRELSIVECAVIPIEKLSAKELAEHKKDLESALEKRPNFKNLKE